MVIANLLHSRGGDIAAALTEAVLEATEKGTTERWGQALEALSTCDVDMASEVIAALAAIAASGFAAAGTLADPPEPGSVAFARTRFNLAFADADPDAAVEDEG